MRRLRRCARLAVLLLATACGPPDAGPDTTLSAAGAAGAEPALNVTSSTFPTIPMPATTVAPTTTVRPAAPATTATTKAPRTAPPPAPPAPPPGIVAGPVPTIPIDNVVAKTTTVTEGSTVAHVRAVTEQYLGEKVYVWVEATSAERITSIRIDFGDGYVTTDPQPMRSTLMTAGTMSAGTTRAHIYPAAGRYRITVTLTVVPGVAAPALSGPPSEAIWLPSGPEHAVTVRADLLQRAEPAPAGYPRLPPMASE